MADHSKFDAVEPHAVATLHVLKRSSVTAGYLRLLHSVTASRMSVVFTSFNKVISKFVERDFKQK